MGDTKYQIHTKINSLEPVVRREQRTIDLVHVKICRSRRHQSRIEEGDGIAQPDVVFYGDVLDAKRGALDTGYNWFKRQYMSYILYHSLRDL